MIIVDLNDHTIYDNNLSTESIYEGEFENSLPSESVELDTSRLNRSILLFERSINDCYLSGPSLNALVAHPLQSQNISEEVMNNTFLQMLYEFNAQEFENLFDIRFESKLVNPRKATCSHSTPGNFIGDLCSKHVHK